MTESALPATDDTFRQRRRRLHPGRALLIAFAALYTSAYFRREDAYLLLDHVDLAVHEAGHVLFAPFGEFAAVAGGSVLQLIVPLVFVAWFAVVRQSYAAFVVLFWVSQSLFNIARYVADARAQILPIVGGEYAIHDWSWMLSRLNLLTHDTDIAGGIRMLAGLLWFTAIVGGLHFAVRPAAPAPDAESRV
jgi:hypothetical protein